jgi:hypothetical protein
MSETQKEILRLAHQEVGETLTFGAIECLRSSKNHFEVYEEGNPVRFGVALFIKVPPGERNGGEEIAVFDLDEQSGILLTSEVAGSIGEFLRILAALQADIKLLTLDDAMMKKFQHNSFVM